MMQVTVRSFCICLALVVFFCITTSASAAVITVDTNSSGGLGTPGCTLLEAIHTANTDTVVEGCVQGSGADTIIFSIDENTPITLTGNYASEVLGYSGAPVIESDITITGNPTILETGEGSYLRVFEIDDTGVLTLNNMTIRDSRGHGIAGAVLVNGGQLKLNNCTLKDNVAEVLAVGIIPPYSYYSSAGALYITEAGTVTIDNSIFLNNSSQDIGGAIVLESGNLSISESTFQNNTSGQAGGIYTAGNGTVTINRSTFTGNSGAGGALYNKSCYMTIENSTFSDNTTLSAAAAILNEGSTTLKNVTIADNYGPDPGIGIYNNGLLYIYNTIVSDSFSHRTTWIKLVKDDVAGIAPMESVANLFERVGGSSWSSGCSNCIIGSDPLLEVLADNGGPTQTRALKKNSPAIDAADNNYCPFVLNPLRRIDQRGIKRNGICDMGAYEFRNYGSVPAILHLLQ